MEPRYTLAEAQQMLAQQLEAQLDEGTHCGTCKQYAKRYCRPLTGAMAYGLVIIGRTQMNDKQEWVHVENVLKNTPGIPSSIRGDFAKLVHWGLVEKAWGKRPDGSTRNGYYRVTPRGFDFMHGRITVPSHANIYNGEFEGFVGDQINIKDAIKRQFDYNEVVARYAAPVDPQPATPLTLFD